MGVTISDNTKGNPLHSDKTGEFVSKDGSPDANNVDIDPVSAIKAKLKTSLKQNVDLGSLFTKLQDINSCSSVGLLKDYKLIDTNLDNLLSKNVCSEINELYGRDHKTNSYVPEYKMFVNGSKNFTVNILICVLGKNRYKDNHAHFITSSEYKELSKSKSYEKIYRGLRSNSDVESIKNGYANYNIHNLGIYGNGCYGTNVYTTTDYSYAYDYADYNTDRLIYGLLKTDNSNSIDSSTLKTIKNNMNLNEDFMTNIENHATKIFSKNGIDDERSKILGKSFAICLSKDISFLAILLGYDYQISETYQRNILNLSKWFFIK